MHMTRDTCYPTLVDNPAYAHNQPVAFFGKNRIDRQLAWTVILGVAATGIYDFVRKTPPSGLLGLHPTASLVAFLASCALTTALITIEDDRVSRTRVRSALAASTLLAVMSSDPTYASLLVTIPLIDIRRRDDDPVRTLWVVGILAIVAALLITEGTRRTTTEIEAMLGLLIALLVVVRLGDALGELDRRVEVESEVARLSERNRLSEDIHDSLGHHLLAGSVQLQTAKTLRDLDPTGASQAVDHAADAVAEAISETRLIVDATHQDAGIDVPAAIRDLARRVVPSSVNLGITIEGDHDLLDTEHRVAIYRVIQESLSNMVRHASATTARITSSVGSREVVVEVSDDGAGFDLNAVERLGGITNMRRRVEDLGGTFEVRSEQGSTTVRATVPR